MSASASAAIVGHRAIHRSQYPITVATCVCCSMTSDTQICHQQFCREAGGLTSYARCPFASALAAPSYRLRHGMPRVSLLLAERASELASSPDALEPLEQRVLPRRNASDVVVRLAVRAQNHRAVLNVPDVC